MLLGCDNSKIISVRSCSRFRAVRIITIGRNNRWIYTGSDLLSMDSNIDKSNAPDAK